MIKLNPGALSLFEQNFCRIATTFPYSHFILQMKIAGREINGS